MKAATQVLAALVGFVSLSVIVIAATGSVFAIGRLIATHIKAGAHN